MPIREALDINYGDSFTTAVRKGWKIAFLSSGGKILTDQFDNFVEYCRRNDLKLLAEFYFYPSDGSEEVVELSMDIKSQRVDEVGRAILQFAFIQNAVLATSDYQAILVLTHDELGILLGAQSVIEEIADNDVESLNRDFAEYTQEWLGNHKLYADNFLKAAALYPSDFDEGSVLTVDLKSISTSKKRNSASMPDEV